MKRIKWGFLSYAILAAVSIVGIGISIGERSITGVVLCILALIVIMGGGFTKKRKLR